MWDEDAPDVDDRPQFEADDVVSALTVAHLDGRPVVVTGGGRFDLSIPEEEETIGGAVRVWDLRQLPEDLRVGQRRDHVPVQGVAGAPDHDELAAGRRVRDEDQPA
ncbi:hypothetical protein [Streptomyces sp. NPDC059010]|uniref:hypothetical protein n=1 Tax=Streptomyces sp. NPDC059010 TaxID=3346695 RepID=UPI003692CC9F